MLSEFSIDLLDEGTRFRSILQVPTFHRRDTILCDFISERNSREERINRNGKILKTDCRFIDLPEGTICAGRQRRKISRCEEIHYRLFCTLENRNIEYGQFVVKRETRGINLETNLQIYKKKYNSYLEKYRPSLQVVS